VTPGRTVQVIGTMAGISIRELWRLHVWVAFAVLTLAIALALPHLSAVDSSSRLKLAVVLITGGIGFVTTLFAMLIGASQLRRDLDSRVSVMLFAKPLPISSYLAGRLLGVVAALGAFLAVMAVVCSALLTLHFGSSPVMRTVAMADGWSALSSSGGQVPIPANQSVQHLGGPIGNGLVFHFSGISPQGVDVLLRVDARSRDPGVVAEHLQVEVLASPEPTLAAAHVLQVRPDSPYGHDDRATGAPSSRVLLRARDQAHQDLSLDYCRLELTPQCVAPDGETWIELVRFDPSSAMIVDRGNSLLLAVDGGSFMMNLARGLAVLLAQATLLCSFTLLVASVSNLAVALLGGLSLYFAGNALWALRETLLYGEPGPVTQRLVHLGLDILPDFDRSGVAAHLAAGQAVSWEMVRVAWTYDGVYAVLFFLLAWRSLKGREL